MTRTASTRLFARLLSPHGVALACSLGLVVGTGTAAAAQIYRSVDADGTVVFSDLPPSPGRTAEPVEVPAANTFTPPAVTPGRTSAGDAGDGQVASPYQTLRVLDPPHDAGIRENAGNVLVTAQLEPGLRAGHILQLFVDGALHQAARATQFQLVNVDRGTHVLELRVVDGTGNTVAESEPSVFHLQRRSLIMQPAAGKSGG
jgi:hypothetical protein